MFVANSGQYESGDYADSAFYHRLILWSADSCGDDRRSVMLGKLAVGLIQGNFMSSMSVHAGF